MLSGSYLNTDVTFLLKVIDIQDTDVNKKEKLIQSGTSHYSEMISPEYEPTQNYLDIFYASFELNKERFANDILTFAYNLSKKKDIVLVSLARAGTPIGVLLKRTLDEVFDIQVPHYSVSIIRDRGIDKNAIKHIVDNHPDKEFIFVDGWTGKGVINFELKKYIQEFNEEHGTNVSDSLYVLSDIAGVSDYAVNNDDYLIPSSALNSTISGLISRSILNDQYICDTDFHGCKYYKDYEKSDLSLWFIDEMLIIINSLNVIEKDFVIKNSNLNLNVSDFLKNIQKEYDISNINYIKPGIGESTRVLLRRVPYIIFIKDMNDTQVQHLIHLAEEKDIQLKENKDLPYTALALIKELA